MNFGCRGLDFTGSSAVGLWLPQNNIMRAVQKPKLYGAENLNLNTPEP